MEQQSDIILSAESRVSLRNRRLALGLSLMELGNFFGIHWTTLSKWECGKIRHCHPQHRNLITDFLSGEYDLWLLGRIESHSVVSGLRIPEVFRQAMLQLSSIFHLLNEHPDLQNRFCHRLDSLAGKLMQAHLASQAPFLYLPGFRKVRRSCVRSPAAISSSGKARRARVLTPG